MRALQAVSLFVFVFGFILCFVECKPTSGELENLTNLREQEKNLLEKIADTEAKFKDNLKHLSMEGIFITNACEYHSVLRSMEPYEKIKKELQEKLDDLYKKLAVAQEAIYTTTDTTVKED